MEEKLRRLMKHEGINSTRLAEILGIQASGISHIMSGRNKPSYDFLLKLLQRFPQISPDWLLLDKGPMYRDEIKKTPVNPVGTAAGPAISSTGGSGNRLGGGSNHRGDRIGVGVGASADGQVGANANGGSIASAGDLFGASARQVASGQSVGSQFPTVGPVSAGGSDDDDIIPAPEHSTGGRQIISGQNADTERIVVFHRDKTFTEYFPET